MDKQEKREKKERKKKEKAGVCRFVQHKAQIITVVCVGVGCFIGAVRVKVWGVSPLSYLFVLTLLFLQDSLGLFLCNVTYFM